MRIIKRDGRVVEFDQSKISSAIRKAYMSVYKYAENYDDRSDKYANQVVKEVRKRYSEDCTPTVENIQDIVEKVLIKNNDVDIAKEYILYRDKRNNAREMNSKLMGTMRDLTFKESKEHDLKRENANIDGDTAMGTMLRYGSEASKQFYEMYLIKPEIAKAHRDGDIHIHDEDFYALTETCCQIDIAKLFKDGFSTGHGFLREPSNIITAAALACIAIQANQNDQHGGQSIPNFDYGLAPYVAKSFVKNVIKYLDMNDVIEKDIESVKTMLDIYLQKYILILDEKGLEYTEKVIHDIVGTDYVIPERCVSKAISYTKKDTFQAMEALIHNLNTMHSRAGAQIPFSSLNYGTDTSEEGRMVMKSILDATWEGLGNGETPIFPIQIFKLKEGVSYNPEDPNYDLFKLACKVSAKRLFPNFSFIDSKFNLQYYKPGHPETEVTYMGCRTRVMGNVYDPSREIAFGRGNLSFTSINLPRLAIKTALEYSEIPDIMLETKVAHFMNLLDEKIDMVFEQLLDRFEVQAKRKVRNYPFLMGQGIWIDSDKLGPDDEIREIIKHGSLSVGFIGLAETLKELTGKHHGESERSQEIGLSIVSHIRERCDKKAEETGLNFTCLATPAEGLSGRFVRLDKKKYGVIPEVTDRDYYTNSFHVPVYYPIDAYHKIHLEAPYHAFTNAGHISYVEVDGDPLQNLDAFEDIIRIMHDEGIGYGSINHPVDRDPLCGYTGIIGDTCPRCGRHDGEEIPYEVLLKLKKQYPEIHLPYVEESEEDDKLPNEVI